MRILILGAGKMGSFFTDLLSFNHDVAVLEKDPRRMRFIYNAQRFTSPEEIADFRPELLINCVTLNATLQAFEEVFPYLPKECIISDIASVKTGLQEFYEKSGFRYVSTHPMFGPTFANLGNLQTENAIIIKESDHMGKIFFKDLYGSLKLNVCEYASIMKHQDAPGTTFKKHMAIARGLLSEDDYLLTEILFNPKTPAQIDNIVATLTHLSKIIDKKDSGKMKRFLDGVRKNLE